MDKPEAVLRAIKEAEVGDDVFIHNSDGSIYCILTVKAKEHPDG